MRLARKLTIALVASVLAVLGVHAFFAARADVVYSERTLARDAHLTGHALSIAVAEIWRRDGEVRALQMIEDANEEDSHVRIRWVWLNARDDDPYAPRAPRAALEPVALGVEVTYRDVTPQGEEVVRTYVPAAIQRGRPGAIELSTSTALQRRYIAATVRNTLITTAAMAAVCGALAMLVGGWFVGRPIRSLVHKARRIGAGDLTGPLTLRQRDEIGVLADEMNAMCERLARARDELTAATAQKITMLEQLRHADRLSTVGKLASGIAHELGTPLNVVSGRARMILDGADGETRESAEVIAGQAQRMANIIRQLLDFARRRSADKSPHDLRQLARQTATLLGPIAEKRRARVVVADGGEATVAEVDAGQLQQALTNLVVNGLQATPATGGTVTVAVQRERARPPADHGGPEDDYLCLSVSDEGEGMSEETMAHIFEPFFTTKPVGEGTGLGLSVTYGIVKEHGGWIDTRSRPGKGSTFRVYLPTRGTP